ncbi:vacuolar protein sorting-associated protein 8 homolog isoform X2 [Rhodamnia argentea]|uniref:Vacuolar protein sorting-associated protein 8 homolog isoform X2 n=1 Tax=Rhodamnia argentea TaxID=178133 RepID=A0A8B8PKL6_9MYRT|nr:vacuolar protein sorting-associated protein 8 homolog isoform X2 [Rhodamnia argentea]
MELDVLSFLNSQNHHHRGDDDDDDEADDEADWTSFPHRTIEEILNDSLSDSDSSPSPPPPASSPPSSPQQRTQPSIRGSLDAFRSLVSPPPPPPPPPPPRPPPLPDDGKPTSSNSRLKAPDSLLWVSSSSRQLPSLFGGVRSNAKPGAALAAAAAASRSLPTPHAAAIKSRRALLTPSSSSSSSSFPSISNSHDALDSSVDALHGLDSQLRFQHKDDAEDDDGKMGEFQSALGHAIDLAPEDRLEAEAPALDEEEEEELVSSPPDQQHSTVESPADSDLVADSSPAAHEIITDDTPTLAIPNHPHEKDAGNEEALEEHGLSEDRDNASSSADIDELVQERIEELESKRMSEKTEKKPQKKPLVLAEEIERKQASTGLHWEEGAAAQPMRLEGVRRGSTTLGYFDVDSDNAITRTISSQAFSRDHGSPQVLQVHPNFIAVGMSKGVILVLPSKYSATNADNMDAKMMILGLQGDRSQASVASMCFNQQGDLLLAGYGDGHITVWDLQRGSAAKIISGEHTAPVVHTLFLGQDSQVTRQFKAVTGDSNGLLLLHTLSVVPLLNRFTVKSQCLLDGQKTGTVLSASPLMYDEFLGAVSMSSSGNSSTSSSSIGSMMGGVVGPDAGWKLFNESTSLNEEGVVILVTHQTALVVRLSPALKVYATLSRPDGVREGSMPYTAWKCVLQAYSSPDESAPEAATERVSLLAIAWDRKVQVAKLVNSELKVYGKWSLDSTAVGVAWLDDQMLVVLTVDGQLCLFSREGNMIHQTSFAVDGVAKDDLVAYHTHFNNLFGNPEKAYHNSIAVRGASIYVLGAVHLVISRLLPWRERIQVLRKAGDWMGALNMAITLYDGQAHGVIDLPRTLQAVQDAIMPYLVELLFAYVDEVFSYISVAFCNQIGKVQQMDDHMTRSSSVRNEIKEQFTRVGGVAVEFCVHINRTDILFDEIFSRFVAVQHRDTFLELLEPYILKDMLSSLPPEIMQALVEHYSSKGWLQRVEQCVLHMDISSLDFNQVVKLCREHGLYCALVYLFNRGLDDFRSPLEELLVVFCKSPKESAGALGYRMLVYLKYCFSGLSFPPGHGSISPTRLPSLRTELLQFLLEKSETSRALSEGVYCNLYHLLELDTEATLDVLRCAFVEDEIQKSDFARHDSANQVVEMGFDPTRENKVVQDLVNALICILDEDIFQVDGHGGSNNKSADAWPSRIDIGHLYEFIASFVTRERAKIPKDILNRILEHLTSENAPLPGEERNKMREKQVLSLLETVPENEWDASYVLHLCEKAQFYEVCGYIYTIRDQYIAALDSYMKDVDEPIHAFAYINNALLHLNETEHAAFRSAVFSRIPALVDLSREGTFLLVIDHFSTEGSRVLSELNSHPESLFLYLKTIIEVHFSGTLDFSCLRRRNTDTPDGTSGHAQLRGVETYLERISDFPKYLRNNPVHVTEEMIEHYFELLCQYDRHSVLKFLETFDSYRVEHCLQLCQEYGITDAAAFLLERVGDVGSALLLTLSSLSEKFEKLDAAMIDATSEATRDDSYSLENFSTVLRMEEVNDIKRTLDLCIGLCQRNTPRLNPEESETLWFKLLDSFCEPLLGLPTGKIASVEVNSDGIYSKSQDDDASPIIKWTLNSHGGAPILRKLISQFIKEIVEGMIGYVRLPTIMSKLLSENGSQEFGDFKLTILGMLGTYGFERRILDTAKSLIEDDTFYTMSLLKKGASHGYSPRSLVCCVCNCLLNKNSSSSTVRVYNCGHATHIQCEITESETSSKGSSSGCPVCLPKKKSQKSGSKSVLGENGLVSKLSSRRQQLQGANVLASHERINDALDNPYSLQQISRFDILNSLQKGQESIQIESLPQLRLAPPAVYHEKVKKATDFLIGESSSDLIKEERASRKRQLRELKAKGSSIRFPLKTNIFGKERTSNR